MPYSTINKPSLHFNTVLYTGDGTSSRGITGTGFQPDWVWNKSRSNAYNHYIFDAVRGAGQRIGSNSTAVEDDKSAEFISFDSDGFTLTNNAGSLNINGSGVTFANWCWKADNTSGSSNTDGSITSTVAANTTAGFSIVSWVGTEASGTVGHGLGATPKVIITKNRSAVKHWQSYHSSIITASSTNKSFINLNETAGTQTNGTATVWTSMGTDTFGVGTDSNSNGSGNNMIAYCFAEVKGYSKFGSYTGNGSTDGAFIYTGFKPAMLIVKTYTTTGGWQIYDNKRDTYNPTAKFLVPSSTAAEASGSNDIDFLSNGFKTRTTLNPGTTDSFIFMAFAEQTLVGTNNVCATAK